MKVLWIDTETTGTNPARHGIVQLALIVEIDGVVHERKSWFMCPTGKAIDPDALRVHGMSREDISKFPPVQQVKPQVEEFLAKYVNRYDKTDKFVPAGFNLGFDMDFFAAMWRDCGDEYFYSFVGGGCTIDPFRTVGMLEWGGLIPELPKRNLVGMCEFFGVKIEKAHNAMSDIEATRELALTLKTIMENGGIAK